MSAHFHPPAEMLIDYASGALREAQSLIVATHLSLCPQCRSELGKCEAIGGALLDQSEGIEVSAACREKMMAMLDEQVANPAARAMYDPFLCTVLPQPLRTYVGCGANDVQWKKYTSTVDRIELKPTQCPSGKARLLRIKAGAPMPEHTHKRHEYTLVLSGSFSDETGTYKRGDFATCDASVTHAPKASAGEDCICLIVTDGSLQLTGLLGRMISPFIRF